MDGRRIDLSATQVIASLLAAVTGAIAASTLGVAGTVIGTAVMSVASTAIASIYKHYIHRSRERLRKAAEAATFSPLISGGASAAMRGRHRAGSTRARPSPAAAKAAAAEAAAAEAAATEPDGDKTQVLPVFGSTQHRWHAADRANGFGRPDDATQLTGDGDDADQRDDATRSAGVFQDGASRTAGLAATSAEAGAATSAEAGAATSAETGDQPPRDDAPGFRWRRALTLAGVAAGIFLLAMAGITAIEAAAGKPLDAIVGGKHNSGTTVGSLFGGQSTGTHHHSNTTPTPTPASTPTPGTSTAPSPTPSPTTAPSPTPTPASTAGAASPAQTIQASPLPAQSGHASAGGSAP